mmetsp:Transcript_12/g.24  ORF Transcript_12/g.24 Transcript_12/m.24 type:complete len:298 (-) Transcript_12:1798-2691(-)
MSTIQNNNATSSPANVGEKEEKSDSAESSSIEIKNEEDYAQEGAEMERRAIEEATATADAAYVPSLSVINASTAEPLLEQVDGPALSTYQTAANIYAAKNVPIKLRDRLDIPIVVSVAGSIVEYTMETELYDISFGITAQRDDGIVVVKENNRVDSHVSPVNGKFLVASVPCQLVFTLDNSYSWFREKIVTYTIKVMPPAIETIISGRRRRAKSALKVVEQDKESVEERLTHATVQKNSLLKAVQHLEKELKERKSSLETVEKEETWLHSRVLLRTSQMEQLNSRLEKGWKDERDIK